MPVVILGNNIKRMIIKSNTLGGNFDFIPGFGMVKHLGIFLVK